MLRVKGFKRKFGDFVLEAEIAMKATDKLALSGRSGCGKSTLLRWMAGLDFDAEGELWLGDQLLSQRPAADRRVGFMFQSPALFPALNVMENLTFGLRVRGASKAVQIAQGGEWLRRLGMESLSDRRIDGLSGGERQRISLGRTLIWEPDLLLLDEPFSALDSQARAEIRLLVNALHRERPIPLLLVSHDLEDIEALGAQTVVLSENTDRTERMFSKSLL